jgi:hypothetical protein
MLENITVFYPLRATLYMDSNVFLTMINCHFGWIFKLFLLSEATSVFSAAHGDILIMDALFFCGSPQSYKLKTLLFTNVRNWRFTNELTAERR